MKIITAQQLVDDPESALNKALRKDPNMPVFLIVASDATAHNQVRRCAELAYKGRAYSTDRVAEAMEVLAAMEAYPERKSPT